MLMMINPKACFSRHSQWPPKSFRLAGLESLCCSILPWMLVSQDIRSGRLRAFALPGLRACAVQSFLGFILVGGYPRGGVGFLGEIGLTMIKGSTRMESGSDMPGTWLSDEPSCLASAVVHPMTQPSLCMDPETVEATVGSAKVAPSDSGSLGSSDLVPDGFAGLGFLGGFSQGIGRAV
ncbi:hypothetical protein FH972_002789 [Carpinus fangiana]|uniref:Uncharacterized protein n=1 Tax=Carpinus fangiana TaxID=176857 RepID=A0A5N6QIK2_9ROSI|nr:hypothetical protein FH972_002789 [Carpinus fangiana]